MTLNEYLENHDASEGAEEDTAETRCPICGSDECEVYAVRDGEIVGCDNCLCRLECGAVDWLNIPCPECGTERPDGYYLRHKDGAVTEIVGCYHCIREVARWEYGI